MRRLSNDAARRIAVAAQGLAAARPTGRVDRRHFRRVIDRVGVLQLDSVNVLERSHYLPVFSRLGPYRKAAVDEFTARSGEMFEYWGHAASLLPAARYRLFHWRMKAMRPGDRVHAVMVEHPDYIETVHAEIAARGPLTVSDLSDPGSRTGPWWGHGKGKTALDWLFATGRIASYRNGNFGRVYDLPERVIEQRHLVDPLDEVPAYRELLLLAAQHHGIGTGRDLADYYRLHLATARRALTELVSSGRLDEVVVDGWAEPAFVDPAARVPRRVSGAALLSPFDSLIWERERVERIFGFRYRIEIYVPEPQRVYGYYVLPFLLDGELVARVDLKAARRDGALLAKAAHLEPGFDRSRVARALAEELRRMASWLELGDIVVGRRGDLAADLAAIL